MKTKITRLLLSTVLIMCCMSGFAENQNATKIEYATDKFMYFILDKTSLTATVTWGGQDEYGETPEYAGSITIPSMVNNNDVSYNVTSIGDCAFTYCTSLTSITIPSGVTSIGEWAFCGCSGLTSIIIPGSVKSIGEHAFDYCSGLTSITIPEGVESIGIYAFYGCSSLTSVTIPSSVTSIRADTFGYCSGLTSITIPSGVTSIGDGAFAGCSGLTSITIPSSVTSIGAYTFHECSGLTSITIPSSVTSIGYSAFASCSSLESLVVLPANPPYVNPYPYEDINTFKNVTNSIPVYVPDVNKYGNGPWGGFTNFKGFNDYKIAAISEIEEVMNVIELTEADKESILYYKGQIYSASDLAAAVAAKEAAMAIIRLPKAKYDAIAEIDNEMEGLSTLTDAEKQSINSYKAAINNATTEGDVNTNKEKALAIIRLQKAKDDALTAINDEMDGETGSAYLNGLVQENVNAINAATEENTVTTNKESAINKIKAVIDIYKAGASEALGDLGTPQTGCPAVKVTKGDKEVILYAPEKVEFIKVSNEE